MSRGLSWQVNDGTLNSNTVTSNVTVAGVDQAPVLSGAGNTVTFTQGGAAVAASSGITVSDVDSLELASATVSIGTGFFAGDTLAAVTTGTSISASYNAGTGVLTLSGSDTVANYQTGARLGDLQLDERQSDQLWFRYQPRFELAGERRYAQLQHRHEQRDRGRRGSSAGAQRCAATR